MFQTKSVNMHSHPSMWTGIRSLHFIFLLTFILSVNIPLTTLGNSKKPNIIVIICDDMGFSDLGCYGGEIQTPNLDRLAYGGIRYTDFHNNAKCSETRATLLTGLWHQQTKNLKKNNHVTVAEVLKSAGYSTSMVGKWHVAGHPMDRGFDQYFGFLSGCINFFNGNEWNSGINNMFFGREPYQAQEGFYSTDAFTQYSIRFIEEMLSDKPDVPFFLYLAHNAPHFPLQAPEKNILKYKNRYSDGWDKLRTERIQKMRKLGIIDENWKLSQRDPKVESWNTLTANQKTFMEPMMEVYAAMVDRLDENIGILVEYLEKKKLMENTLIFFMSDNGACPYQRVKSQSLIPGPEESDIAYDARWANACNTPLRLYKQYAHNGGTLTPLIVHWPAQISQPGRISNWNGHIVDILPTLMDITGATYPGSALPLEGESMAASFVHKNPEPRNKAIYWEFSSNHAIRKGDWKLVAERSKDWELYHIPTDRTESSNLVLKHPDKVSQLAQEYDAWAKRTGAPNHFTSQKRKPSSQSQLFNFEKLLESRK